MSSEFPERPTIVLPPCIVKGCLVARGLASGTIVQLQCVSIVNIERAWFKGKCYAAVRFGHDLEPWVTAHPYRKVRVLWIMWAADNLRFGLAVNHGQ